MSTQRTTVTRRRDRYRLRGISRRVLSRSADPDRFRRLRACGAITTGGDAAVVRNIDRHEFGGIQSCGSIWACPVCAARLRSERAILVNAAVEMWTSSNASRDDDVQELADLELSPALPSAGSVALMTVTIPHTRLDSTRETLGVVQDSWRRMQQGRAWISTKEELDLVGLIRSTEITYGDNGPHAHIHALLFFDQVVTGADLNRARGILFERWAHVVEKFHGRSPQSTGFDLRPVRHGDSATVAGYVAKNDIGSEVTRLDMKKRKANSRRRRNDNAGTRTPYEVLADAAHDQASADLWCEYVDATHGRRSMSMTRDLADRLGPAFADLAALDDLQDVPEPEGEVVMTIPGHIFNAMTDDEKLDLLDRLDAEYAARPAITSNSPPLE